MKIEIERQEFLKAWQIAERSASTKSTMESTGGILITASNDFVTLEATDLKTSVKCKAKGVQVIEGGVAVVPVVLLGSLLKKINESTANLEVNNERGFLKAGKSKTRFTIIPVQEFPGIPRSSGAEEICEIMASDLVKLVNEGTSASSAPADFPKYLGTCLLRISESFIKTVATDGKRLSLSKALCNAKKNEDLLLPAPAMKDLSKMISNTNSDAMIKILADGSTVWFGLEDVEFSIRRVESVFPNYERILNSEVRTTLRIPCFDLISALDRIDIISRATPAHIVAISLSPDGELRLTARAPEFGTTTEILDAKIDGSNMNIGFNVGYLQDGLKALGQCEALLEFSDEEGQARLLRDNSDDFLYMLMPARLGPQDAITEEENQDFNTDLNNNNNPEETEIFENPESDYQE